MVDFNLGAALVSGLVATLVMSAMMQMSASARMTKMPPMPAMHPRMSRRLVPAGGSDDGSTVVTGAGGELELRAPGVLGKEWGAMTPVGLLMGHAVYGVVLALLYGWLT